jgi:hypothetical protein
MVGILVLSGDALTVKDSRTIMTLLQILWEVF